MPTAAKHTASNRRTAAKGASARAGKDDAIKLLKADHKEVSEMVEKFENGRLSKDRKVATAKQICMALTVHAQIEEEIFYPAIERQLGTEGATLITEARKEHTEMKRAMSKLRASEFAGPEGARLLQEMMKGVQHHVQEEESELLPTAQQQLGGELERLGNQMQQRKQEVQHTKLRPGSQERVVRRND